MPEYVTVGPFGYDQKFGQQSAQGMADDLENHQGRLLNLEPLFCRGRLTTESGVPISTADRTAQATIYFTPFTGTIAYLYTGGGWKAYTLSEVSLALTGLTSGKLYDVFLYDNAGTLALALSAAWTNDTTQADAIGTQDGIDVLDSDHSRRWVGTIRTTGTTTTEDSQAKRLVWNRDNRILRPMVGPAPSGTWTYGTSTLRQANADATMQLAYVVGVNDRPVAAAVRTSGTSSSGGAEFAVDIGVDVTNAGSAPAFGGLQASGVAMPLAADYLGFPGVGYHFLAWLEKASATSTFLGASGAYRQGRIYGSLYN